MKATLLILLSGICFIPGSRVIAQPWWSVGPKLGATFGSDGGLTFGAEVSFLWPANDSKLPEISGITLDINYWKDHDMNGHFSIHSGFEAWYYVGIDAGPTLFFSQKGVSPGISLIAWSGLIVYPYYELGIPFNGELFNEVGAYLKIPLENPIHVNTTVPTTP